ncbi:Minf_1886 family protein [Candidatus Omnitrophota bacterium]
MASDFYKKVEEIIGKDKRYKADAYEFVMHALGFTQKKLKRQGHVTGAELVKGIRDMGLELYGPMALNVLTHWGIKTTSDFGEMVFNMIECGLMGKTEKDSRKDFRDIYDLKDVFDSKKQFKLKEKDFVTDGHP